MDIEDFLIFDAKIEKKKLIFSFTANGNEITELRMLHFINKMEKTVIELNKDEIKKVYFLFDIQELCVPTNYSVLKNFAEMMKNHEEVLTQKLEFTIIYTKNNVFRLFFNFFRKYYDPVKPLYLCKTDEEVYDCFHDEEKRKQFPNIITLIENSENSH